MEDIKKGNDLLRISPREVKILSVAAVVVLLVLAYMHHFHNGYFYDDSYLIQENLSIRSLHNIPKFFTDIHTAASRPEYQNQYRPLYQTSFAIDYYLAGGLSFLEMHIHTFIGFIILCCMCFLLGMKMFKTVSDEPFYPALLATAVFALHPSTADVVNYLYARTNSFSTLYGMIYMIMYIYLPRARKYHLYLIPLIVGCLFKSTTVAFVPLLWLYLMLFEWDMGITKLWSGIKKGFRPMLPSIIIIALGMIVIFEKSGTTLTGEGRIPYSTHLLTQTHVLLNYFLLFFMPENLNPNGWRDFITSPLNPQFLSGFVFVVSSIIAIYLFSMRKSLRPLSYGLAWFFICQIPTSILLPLSIPQVDYYMFTSVIGLAFGFAAVALILNDSLKDIKIAKPAIIVASLICVAVFAYGSRVRTRVWSSDEAMWEDVVKKDPTNGRVLMNLGVYLMAQNKLDEALDDFNKAAVYYPNYDLIYVNLGIIKNLYKDTLAANANFSRAVQLKGWDHYEACFFYARFLDQWNHDNDAIPLLQTSVEEYPSYLDAWNLLLSIYNKNHDSRAAIVSRRMLQLFPGNDFAGASLKAYMSDSTHYYAGGQSTQYTPAAEVGAYINLSVQYFKSGDFEKCIEICKKALQIDPSSALAYNNICSAYNNLHQWDKAIEAGRMAIKLQPDLALAQNNLNFAIQQKKKGSK